MGFIHYKCLKQCIKVRITIKEAENYICYLWKNYECEICLEEYPKYIKYKSTIYDLIEYTIPYQEYLIFDYTIFDDSKKKTNRKGIIIVKITDEEIITIGRNQSNIIKLKDISVSRNHCYIFKKENKIYIADKSSKFGTLLYVNRPFTLTNNTNIKKPLYNINNNNSFIDNQVNLVSGKNYFGFKMTTSWSLFGNLFSNTFCCKCKNSDEEYVLNLETFKDYEDDRILDIDHSNDSYLDYCINLDTIIKNGESNVNNNNSFI
jgi:pSer/pThr/pTyr-binding forkhead associated (FHA) protein